VITTNYVVNKINLVTKSLSRFSIDIFYKYLYYNLLSSRFFYYSNFILFFKKRKLPQFALNSNFKKKRVYTILRSPFIHKKSREQFEYRVFKSNFAIYNIFNTSYLCTPFTYTWLFFLVRFFKNNHSQIQSDNTYFLTK
jgi:hypothetical protein